MIFRGITNTAIFLAAATLVIIAYGLWADQLDGRYIFPILEMGHRAQQFTHETTKTVYHPGEMVWARVLFHKNRSIDGVIHWNLIDGREVSFPCRSGTLPEGVWDKKVRVEQIPEDVVPGEHWFAGTVTYYPNWLSSGVTYQVWTNRFQVVRP